MKTACRLLFTVTTLCVAVLTTGCGGGDEQEFQYPTDNSPEAAALRRLDAPAAAASGAASAPAAPSHGG
jgi:hypothetical protein